jgi:hypothetical protein
MEVRMDELSTWYEVLRSLLPQRYAMRLLWERRAIIVTSEVSDNIVWIYEDELPGCTPGAVVAAVRRRLRSAEMAPAYVSAR